MEVLHQVEIARAPSAVFEFLADTRSFAAWTVAGDTSNRPLFQAKFFNDAGAPELQSGPASVAWWCVGVGRLEIALVRVAHAGPIEPDLAGSIARIVVDCPSSAGAVRLLPAGVIGNENAVMSKPAVEPSAALTYTVIVAQASRP